MYYIYICIYIHHNFIKVHYDFNKFDDIKEADDHLSLTTYLSGIIKDRDVIFCYNFYSSYNFVL